MNGGCALKTFSYVATDVNGKIYRGKQSAEDAIQLVEALRAKNLFCTRYKDLEKKASVDVKYKFKTKDLAFLSRQLSSMLTSGLTLVRALHILQSQQTNKKAKAVLLDIYEDVQKGTAFSKALSDREGVFPPLFVSMVGAGEASGNLDVIMTRVSDHYAKEHKINNKIKSAMTYPIILGALCIVIVVGMFTFIMPMFMGLFGEGAEIPPLSQAMMDFSVFLREQWYIMLIIVIAVVIVFRILLGVDSVRFKIDEFKLKIPKVGKLLSTIYTGRFSRTMSNLFASGLQMVDCIQKSEATLNNKYISKQFEKVIEDVKKGENLSTSIQKTGVFEPMFSSMIYVGEESGTLDTILSKTADYYEEESETAIGKLVSMMEPLLIIVMGVCVALILAAIFPMLYSSFEGLGA